MDRFRSDSGILFYVTLSLLSASFVLGLWLAAVCVYGGDVCVPFGSLTEFVVMGHSSSGTIRLGQDKMCQISNDVIWCMKPQALHTCELLLCFLLLYLCLAGVLMNSMLPSAHQKRRISPGWCSSVD